jgi:uncharacterized protein (DUF433 family)
MQLEEYFEFEPTGGIRIKGHRIWIEHVLYEYIYNARTPEEIAKECFDTLTLDKIYATILFYLRDKEKIGQYMVDWMEGDRKAHEEFRRTHPEFVEKMRRLKEEMAKKKPLSI